MFLNKKKRYQKKLEKLEEQLLKAEIRKSIIKGYCAKNSAGLEEIVEANQEPEIIRLKIERLRKQNDR